MIKTFIYKNMYQDSIKLMLLSQKVRNMPDIDECSVTMATPSNLLILDVAKILTKEAKEANPDDILLIISSESEEAIDKAKKYVDDDLNGLHYEDNQLEVDSLKSIKTIEAASNKLGGANIALISVPGKYAPELAHKAIDISINPMIFSDNVSLEDEIALKSRAQSKGLIVMGPDCGTSIISGVGLGFANSTQSGKVGIIGASGTGIQEVISLLDINNVGISHAIGVGGRDLDPFIGGISTLKAIEILGEDIDTDIIVIVSKPADNTILEVLCETLRRVGKPSVIILVGMDSSDFTDTESIKYSDTLKNGTEKILKLLDISYKEDNTVSANNIDSGNISGLYTGGTLAYEALHILSTDTEGKLSSNIGFKELDFIENIFSPIGNFVIDLGDDTLTEGRAHPMINPSLRNELVEHYASVENVSLVMLDFVLGYGSNEDPVGAILPSIKTNRRTRKELGYKEVIFLAHVCGTKNDFQDYKVQTQKLLDNNISVFESNASMVNYAKELLTKNERSRNG